MSLNKQDPDALATSNRLLMMRKMAGANEYLVAEIEGSGQAGNSYDTFFRYKDYVKERPGLSQAMKDWLKVPGSEIWSPKFLGLDSDGVQKLEFQNPAYVAALKLGGDPRDYNRVFVVQLIGCTYECPFCYVPKPINDLNDIHGQYFSAKAIVDAFEKLRAKSFKDDGVDIKVIRITGGEAPTIVPELIVDIWRELDSRGLCKQVYLWIDTNLSTPFFMKHLGASLKDVLKQQNVGIVGCLKAIGNESTGKIEFSLITNCSEEYFANQFETISLIVKEFEADFYLYIIPIIDGTRQQIEARLFDCVFRLRKIDLNLPLRANIIHIHYDYPPVAVNINNASSQGRKLPPTDEKVVLSLWYNSVLPKLYSDSMLSNFRCQIPLRVKQVEQTSNNTIVWFKSAAREEYKSKILTALSLPIGSYLNTWYDEKWVSEDLWIKLQRNSDDLKTKEGLMVFVDHKKDPLVFYPLRRCTFYSVEVNGARALLWLQVGDYCKYTKEELTEFNLQLRKTAPQLPNDKNSYAQLLDLSDVSKCIKTSSKVSDLEELTRRIFTETEGTFSDSNFYWFDIVKAKNNERVEYKDVNGIPYISLQAKERYKLLFNYLVPIEADMNKSNESMDINIKFGADFYPTEKLLHIPRDTRILVETIPFQCAKSGESDIEIVRCMSPKNSPNPLIKTAVSNSKLNYASGGLVFIGLMTMAIPQIVEVPTEFAFLSPVLSLVIGPAISAFAVWLGNK